MMLNLGIRHKMIIWKKNILISLVRSSPENSQKLILYNPFIVG